MATATPPPPRVGWVSGGNNRGTLSLVWSCVFTIFICTWTVQHLAVHGTGVSKRTFITRKLRWMGVNLFLPDAATANAMMQFLSVRRGLALIRAVDGYREFTWTQAWYLEMGGLVVEFVGDEGAEDSGERKGVEVLAYCFNCQEVAYLIKNGHLVLHRAGISEREIKDKSKADVLAKVLTFLQSGWFVLQCIGRGAQRLPLSELEIATVAFITCAWIDFVLWYRKPLDVTVPTTIHINKNEKDVFPVMYVALAKQQGFPSHFAKRLVVSNDVFATYGFSTNLCNLFLTLFTVVYAGIHCIAWNFSFPTPIEQTLWRIASATATVLPVVLLGLTAVLEKYDIHREFKIFNKVFDALKLERRDTRSVYVWPVTCVCLGMRTYLMLAMFINLRSVPQGTYQTVNWLAYLPHFQ